MTSTRLPGKVLKPIVGYPMLSLQIDRLKRSRKIDHLVVATSLNEEDQPIADACQKMGTDFFRGDVTNVLDRFYQAARKYRPDHVVRITGDCPLIDPQIVDELVTFYLDAGCDYASNCRPPSYPVGLDGEILSFSALEKAWKAAGRPDEKEHVVVYIITHPDRFQISNYRSPEDLSHLRWTVDEPEDLEFVQQVFEAIYPVKPDFTMKDVLDLLECQPELMDINSRHSRRRKYEQIRSK